MKTMCSYISDYQSLVCVLMFVLFMVHSSYQKSIEPAPLSEEIRNCIIECTVCMELWGYNYDGEACATNCKLSDGASIDSECIGTGIGYMPKRYTNVKLDKKRCNRQCDYCERKMTYRHYDTRKCYSSCYFSNGRNHDSSCSNYMSFFNIIRSRS